MNHKDIKHMFDTLDQIDGGNDIFELIERLQVQNDELTKALKGLLKAHRITKASPNDTMSQADIKLYVMREAVELADYTLATQNIGAEILRKRDASLLRPDCNTCANRGQVLGLSQDTVCEHCRFGQPWKPDMYKQAETTA